MKMTTVFGVATVALGAALAIGLSTRAQAAAPANYARACTKVVASDSVVEKALYARRVARRAVRRTARRHHY
ncbi:MAG: hypothetical protein WCC90_08515 [Methylocella sp.]